MNRKISFTRGARVAKISLFFTGSLYGGPVALGFCVRGYRLPPADFEYKSLGAIVFKDRNPKGTFKIIPSANGIITIIISIQSLLFPEYFSAWYTDVQRSMEQYNAFISHLDEEVYYKISIVARKAKHNITIYYQNEEERINKEKFSRELKDFYN